MEYRFSTLAEDNRELSRSDFLKIMRSGDASEKFELYSDGTCVLKDNGDDGYRCLFALQVGYADIEAQLYAVHDKASGVIRPSVEYFCCTKFGDDDGDWESDDFICSVMSPDEIKCRVDFNAADWDRQMEKDMEEKLYMYCERKGYDIAHPIG